MNSAYQNLVPGESCFNLNFSNPGGGQFLTPSAAATAAEIRHLIANGAAASSSLKSGGRSSGGSSANCSPQSTKSSGSGGGAEEFGLGPAGRHFGGRRGGAGAAGLSCHSLPNGKKTKGRVKIKMEFIDNKLRRYTTFSKRKTGIMKKAYELSTLTGTQVMLLVASETGHVYTFATKKLQPMITSEAGKALIQSCLNSPEFSDGSGDDGFHTSEIPPPLQPAANGKRRKFDQSPLSFQSDDDTDDVKDSPKWATNHLQPPTMVPRSSPYGGVRSHGNPAMKQEASDEIDGEFEEETGAGADDDSDGESNSFRNPFPPSLLAGSIGVTPSLRPGSTGAGSESHLRGVVESVTSAVKSGGSQRRAIGQNHKSASPAGGGKLTTAQQAGAAAAAMFKMPTSAAPFLFPGFIPTNGTSNAGFGIAPNGALMYQMPPGMVFGPGGLDAASAQNFMFGFPQHSSDQSSGQQQFITIPVPFPMPQSILTAGDSPTYDDDEEMAEGRRSQADSYNDRKVRSKEEN